MACTWVMQARVQEDIGNTWMGRLGYCVQLPAPSTKWECPPVAAYAAGLYYAAATITSIGCAHDIWDGMASRLANFRSNRAHRELTSPLCRRRIGRYGDVTPTLTNTGEVFTAAILMFSSCVVWAHLIGVFSGVISSFSPEMNEFRASMDKVSVRALDCFAPTADIGGHTSACVHCCVFHAWSTTANWSRSFGLVCRHILLSTHMRACVCSCTGIGTRTGICTGIGTHLLHSLLVLLS